MERPGGGAGRRMGVRSLTLLVLLLATLVPLATAGALGLAVQRSALTDRVADDLDQYADAQLARLTLITDAAGAMGQLVTSRTLLRELVTDAAGDPGMDTTRIVGILDDARDGADGLRSIVLLRTDGTTVAATSPEHGLAGIEDAVLARASATAAPDRTVLTLLPDDEHPRWLATAPMVQGDLLVAFAVLDVDPGPILELLTVPVGASQAGPVMHTCLFVGDVAADGSTDGQVPTCVTPAAWDPDDVGTHVTSAAEAVLRGERLLSTERLDDSGNLRVVATRPLPEHGWGLVVSVPSAALLAPVTEASWMLVGLLTAVAAAAVVTALLVARGVTRPIVALQGATTGITTGAPEVPLPRSAPAELESLRQDFVRMAQLVAEEQASQEDRYRDLEMLAHAMAHDLKGPLTVIRGMLELLDGDRVSSDEDRRMLVTRSLASAQRMQGLIDDLLTLMRAIGAPIDARAVDLGSVVQEAVSELGLEEVTTIGPLPVVHGERTLLAQIVLNLLHNAAAYHAPDEPVRIEVSTGARRDGLVAVQIDDAGLGIAAHERAEMLETFARGTAADQRSGTGLGLPIAKRVAERHGGRIELDDAPIGGARIRVWLPEAGRDAADDQSEDAVV